MQIPPLQGISGPCHLFPVLEENWEELLSIHFNRNVQKIPVENANFRLKNQCSICITRNFANTGTVPDRLVFLANGKRSRPKNEVLTIMLHNLKKLYHYFKDSVERGAFLAIHSDIKNE